MTKPKFSPYILVFSLFLALSLTSCASNPVIDADTEPILYPRESYIPESFDWQEVQPGIDRFDYTNPNFPIIYHAVRIDLTTPGLELVCTPDAPENATTSADDSATTNTGTASASSTPQNRSRRVATSTFAAEQNCIVAINTTQFDFSSINGIHKVNGTVLSEPVEKYAVLAFRREQNNEQGTQKSAYGAAVFSTQNANILDNYDFAFGGFFVVLQDSEVLQDYIRRHTSRTGAGISADGHTLYILVAEGEKPLQSEGLSYPQCGEIFKAMGCTDALEFDGGGSTELCINGVSVLSYKNRRTQATSLGFTLPSPMQE